MTELEKRRWIVHYLIDGHGMTPDDRPYLTGFWTDNPHQATLSILNRYNGSDHEVTVIKTEVFEISDD